MSWAAYGFLVSHAKHMSSVECGENCETSKNYQLNVARHAFSCSMSLVSFDPFGALAFALCRRHIKCSDVSVLSDNVRFSNMSTEWGGYHLHLLLESLPYSLSVLL
jgi:hypothetical protein